MSLKAEVNSCLMESSSIKSFIHINWHLVNEFGSVMSYILNGHATSRAVDESGASCSSIKRDTQVQLLLDSELFHNVDGTALETLFT